MTMPVRIEWVLKNRHSETFDLDNPRHAEAATRMVDWNWYDSGDWFEGTDAEWDALCETESTPRPTAVQVRTFLREHLNAGYIPSSVGDNLIQESSDDNWLDCDTGDVEASVRDG